MGDLGLWEGSFVVGLNVMILNSGFFFFFLFLV